MKSTKKGSSTKKFHFSFMFLILSLVMLLVTTAEFGFAETVTCDADAFIAQNAPDTNMGDSTQLLVGRDSDNAGSEFATYLRFDFSSIPQNADIESANLILYRVAHVGSLDIAVHRVTSLWSENSVTCNYAPYKGSTKWVSFFTSTSGNTKTVNITSLVKYEFENDYYHYGYLLWVDWDKGIIPPNNYVSFASKEAFSASNRPTLEVTYSIPEPDLTKSSANINKTTVEHGDFLDVEVTVENIGDADSDSSYIYYYFNDEIIYSNDHRVGSDYVKSLTPGETSEESVNVIISEFDSPGTYYMYYWIDAKENIDESDESNNKYYWTITIAEPVNVTVTSPNGGEEWEAGTGLLDNITWTSSGDVGLYVNIELYKDGYWNRTIDSSTSNDGKYSWGPLSSQTIGTDYKIRITSTSDSSIFDESDSNFSITSDSSNQSPVLSNGYVSPESGDSNTDFYWYVDYYDPDGDSPSTPSVYITEEEIFYIMSLYSGLASNGTYCFGPKKLDPSNYSYYFEFSDGFLSDRFPQGSETLSGPNVESSTDLPGIPGNLSASKGTYLDKVKLTFTRGTNAHSTMVYRNTIDDTESAELLDGGVVWEYYNDTTAEAGTIYYYFVKGAGYSGTSDFSDSVTGWRGITGAPDLVIDSITHYPRNPTTGDDVTFSVTVKNQGSGDLDSGDAGKFNVGFWSNRSTEPVIGDTPEMYQDIDSLSAGASEILDFVVTAQTEGSKRAWAYADRYENSGEIEESDENNNVGPDEGYSWRATETINPDDDNDDTHGNSGGSSDESNCFITTASY